MLNKFSPFVACGLSVGVVCLKDFWCWLEPEGLHNDSQSVCPLILLNSVFLNMLCALSKCLIQNALYDISLNNSGH